jgi:hypothetical protein
MDHREEFEFPSSQLDFHIQSSLDPLQDMQLYRKLVEDELAPNSKAGVSLHCLVVYQL